jgi:hypothetical protein
VIIDAGVLAKKLHEENKANLMRILQLKARIQLVR